MKQLASFAQKALNDPVTYQAWTEYDDRKPEGSRRASGQFPEPLRTDDVEAFATRGVPAGRQDARAGLPSGG
jgi:hypothetical protein